MPDRPVISVIVPVKNREALIGRAVRSALNQREFAPGELEILVVDDGSTDATRDVVESIARNASHPVRLLQNNRKPGANGGRNTGILASRGTWIAPLDSDDAFAPDKLHLQLAALARTRCRTATCSWATVRTNGRISRHIYRHDMLLTGWKLSSQLAWDTGFSTQTFLVHRSVVDAAGLFDETLRRRQDYEWSIRLSRQGPILAVARALVMVWQQRVSITADPSLIIPSTRSILAKHRWLYARHPGSLLAQAVKVGLQIRRARRMAAHA